MDLERGSGQGLCHLCNCRSRQTRLGEVRALVVLCDSPGMSFGPLQQKMGARSIISCSIYLSGAWVRDIDHVGAEGAGCAGLMRSFKASLCLAGAAATELCRAATDRRVVTRATRGNPSKRNSKARSHRPIGGYGRPRRKIPPSRVASGRTAGCGAALRKTYARC